MDKFKKPYSLFVYGHICSGKTRLLKLLRKSGEFEGFTFFETDSLQIWDAAHLAKAHAEFMKRLDAHQSESPEKFREIIANVASSPPSVQVLKAAFFFLAIAPKPFITINPAITRHASNDQHFFRLLEGYTGNTYLHIYNRTSLPRLLLNVWKRSEGRLPEIFTERSRLNGHPEYFDIIHRNGLFLNRSAFRKTARSILNADRARLTSIFHWSSRHSGAQPVKC